MRGRFLLQFYQIVGKLFVSGGELTGGLVRIKWQHFYPAFVRHVVSTGIGLFPY